MSAAPSRGQLVPLRRLDERRAAVSDISDEALLAACGIGDAAALGALFDRHHDAMYRLVSRLLSAEPGEIDDLVQTTFLEAWRSARGFRGKGSVRSWLYGIAANAVRHHVRSAVRRRGAVAGMPEPAPGRGPDDALARARMVGQLAVAMDALPHDQRAAFVLCDLEEVAGVEAARVLGVRAGTLWRRLHEARRALRAALGDRFDGGAR